MKKVKTPEMELKLASHFNYERNLIIPNLSWGVGMNHECDLLVITKTGYATEIEIKVTAADLKADKKKRHKHNSPKIKNLYFCIPWYLIKHYGQIPKHAGILILKEDGYITEARKAPKLNNYKFSGTEIFELARMCNLRMWSLKRKINGLNNDRLNEHVLKSR